MKFARWSLAILLLAPLGVSAQQAPQDQSSNQGSAVADAARASREAKKDQAKTPRVWDNDNIPSVPGNVNVVGPSSSDNTGSADSAQNNSSGGQETVTVVVVEDKAVLQNKLASAKEKLQSMLTDLDILQRTLALDQNTYYSKPDFQNDTSLAAKLKDEQAEISTKQKEIEEQQKRIADLQAQVNAAPDAKSAAPPAAPPPSETPAPQAGGDNGGNSGSPSGGSQDQEPPPSSEVPN